MGMRILHLSDMHYSKDNQVNFEVNLLDPMIADLSNLAQKKKFDLIIYSGDLIDKGGKSFENDLTLGLLEFEQKVIEPILNKLNLNKSDFILLPGNHDIEREKDDKYVEKGLLEELNTYEKVSYFMEEKRNEDNWVGIERVKSFKEFEQEFYGLKEVSKFETLHISQIEGESVGIAAFNTSWRCYGDEDKGKVILGESQIDNAIKFFKEKDCQIKIAVLHHPLDELHLFEAKDIQNKIYREFDMVFTGHVHFSESHAIHDLHGKTIISKAPANWTGNIKSTDINYLNGYSVLDYNLKGEIILTYRKYSNFRNEFVANTDRGDDLGQVRYKLPSQKQLSLVDKQQQILEVIKDYHLEDINNHLLTYNTDTSAPRELNELFVAPKLTFKREVDVEGDFKRVKDEEVNYGELFKSNENFIIFGTKESGKTVLLDKLLLEFTDGGTKYNFVPIWISFKDIQQNNNIDVLVSRYLHEPIKDIRNGSLDEINKVLLIDNINFNDIKGVNKLKEFIDNNKNYRYIATSNITAENELPASALNSELIKQSNTLFINQFQTKEIKELLNKWFSNRTEIIPNEKSLDKILETFKSLNLPRTPMAVSMFLWIIEKQENYVPINNAQMLENFLEKLFSKADVTEVRSSDFNYKNKETLLTEIAYFMFKKNDIYYRVKQSELVEFISSRLKARMYRFDEVDILNDFIKKGIFSKQQEELETFIIFKFSCFYHYYLMKNINRKPDFKKYLLSGENIIYFMEEIEYYTGINMEDSEVFESVINKMKEKFKNVAQEYATNNKLDFYYETNKNFIDYIEREELNNWLQESKETEEDYESSQNELLEDNCSTIVNKNIELNPLEKFERHWVLAAKVIKNSEEIEEAELRIRAIKDTVNCAVLYMTMYKILIQLLEKNLGSYIDDEFRDRFFMINRLLPVFQQIIISQTLGTGKLIIPIEQILKEVLPSSDYSEIEKFVYLFLYSDLKGDNYQTYINDFIKNFKSWYMRDMVFTKLFEYFIRKDTPKEDESYFSNHMAKLIEDGKGDKKGLNSKGKIITKLKDLKLEMNFKTS